MTTDRMRFEFSDEAEDGKVRAIDDDGYPVTLDIGNLTTIRDDGEKIVAEWEDIVCPILYQESKEAGVDDQVTLSIDECVDRLVDAVESSIDTGNIEKVLSEEARERHARVVIEYLVEEEVLPLQDGEIALLSQPDINVSENILEGKNDGARYLLMWIGLLDRIHQTLEAQYDQVESKFDRLEDRVAKQEEQEQELQERLKDARAELYDITDGRKLQPEETDEMNKVKVPPQELEDEHKRNQFKRLWNRIASLNQRLKGPDIVEEAKETLNNLIDEFDRMKTYTDTQINDMRTLLATVYNEDTGQIELSQEDLDNIGQILNQASEQMNEMMQVGEEVRQMSTDDIYGEPVRETERTATNVRNEMEETQEKLQETKEQVGVEDPG